MTPFSKLTGILSILAAVFGALNTADILTLVPPSVGTAITLGAVVLAALSHSLTGAGDQPTAGDKP